MSTDKDTFEADDRRRKSRSRRGRLLSPVIALGLAAAASIAAAQPPAEPASPAEPAPPTADSGNAEADDDRLATELERARRELEAARRNLESAAREVARLSAESVGPVVRDFRRQWLGTGQRALLGIVIADTEEGAVVNAVSPGGPADEAGIRIGDVIVAIDGTPVLARNGSPSRRIIRTLSEIEPGTPVELRVRSGDETRAVRVTTREREDRMVRVYEGPGLRLDRLGPFLFRSSEPWSSMELVPLTPELGAYFGAERGLLVVRAPDEPALQLRDGDVILAIGGREPRSPEHALGILATYEPGERLMLSIMRERQRQTLEIELPSGDTSEEPDTNDEPNA